MSVDENVSIKHVDKNIDDNMWIKCIAKSGPQYQGKRLSDLAGYA